MSTINKIAIKNSLGEYDESKIGAQAEDVIISRDENGKIIENIETPGVTISSTEGIATTVKEIDERVATDSSIGQIQVGSGFNIDANGILTPTFGNTTGSICEGNDPRLAGIGTVTNNLTLSSNGDGDAAGTTFNGGAAVKISYNSIGAAPNQKATTSQWGQIKIKSNSGLGIDSTNGLSLSSHASASNIYGVGTNANYGHLKIVDATSNTSGTSYNAAAGVAASASSVANVISQISKLENPDYDSDWIVVPPQSWGQFALPSGKFFSAKSRMTCICQQTARYFINYNANTSGTSSICQAFNNESANIAVRFLIWL